MEAWIIWLIAGVVAAVGEILTLSFFLAPFAVGAVAGMVVALVGGGVLSLIAFAAVTSVTFGLLRPVARAHLSQPAHGRTGTAALIGRSAVVLQEIVNDKGVGTVKLEGEVWTARSLEDDDVIAAGTRVQVIEIRGATAVVTE
jgi:membrane protein implicated in regulation of membrane protease activity